DSAEEDTNWAMPFSGFAPTSVNTTCSASNPAAMLPHQRTALPSSATNRAQARRSSARREPEPRALTSSVTPNSVARSSPRALRPSRSVEDPPADPRDQHPEHRPQTLVQQHLQPF